MATSYQTVDQYIDAQPKPLQAVLKQVRRAIRKAAPNAVESISYRIPAYKVDGQVVVYFAGWKEHTSLYPVTAPVVAALGDALAGYELSKGTVRFPLTRRVPVALIGRITKLLTRAAAERAAKKRRRPA